MILSGSIRKLSLTRGIALTQIWNVLNRTERRKLKWQLLLNIVLNVVDVLSVAFTLWLIKELLGEHSHLKILADTERIVRAHAPLFILALLMLLALKNLALYQIKAQQYRFNYQVSLRLAEEQLFDSLNSNYADFIDTDSAAHIYKIGQQPIEFAQYLLTAFQQIIIQSVLVAMVLIAVVIYNPLVLLLLILFLLPPVLLSNVLIKKKTETIRQNNRVKSEKSIQHLKEFLNGYVEHHIFNTSRYMADRYLFYQNELNASLGNLQTIQALPAHLFEVFAVAAVFIVLLTTRSDPSGEVSKLIPVGAFMAATYKVVPGLLNMIKARGQINAYRYLLQTNSNIKQQPINDNDSKPADAFREIAFHNITFRHPRKQVFHEFSAVLKAGEFVGLQGPSGKGKSTLVNLLLGFHLPETGVILWNGKPTNTASMRQIRQHISYVKQQPYFIHDTLLKNIVPSNEPVDMQRLYTAMAASGADKLMRQFPEGLRKVITENGGNLSGGQRQRIVLARALYKPFDLLILDEPFSELDETAELEILEQLQELTNFGKTILLITHNQNSLQFCNRIINLHEIRSLSYT